MELPYCSFDLVVPHAQTSDISEMVIIGLMSISLYLSFISTAVLLYVVLLASKGRARTLKYAEMPTD